MVISFWRNKLFIAIIFGIFFTLGIGFLAYFKVFTFWQLQLTDKLYFGLPARNDIVIVKVDIQSMSENGLGLYSNWDRSYFAQVLDNVNKYNPKVVAFDFMFLGAKDATGDKKFQNALAKTPKVIIGSLRYPDIYDLKGYFKQVTNNVTGQQEPLALFSNLENVQVSAANFIQDEDEIARRLMPFIFNERTNKYYENFAFAIAREFWDGENLPNEPLISPQNYKINLSDGSSRNIPLEQGQMLINFPLKEQDLIYNNISFTDVYNENYQLYGKRGEDLFKDKIVLIGPTAEIFKDSYFTPLSSTQDEYGVVFQASALQTILDQSFLRNFTLVEQVLLILLVCMSGAFVFMFTKIRWSVLYLFALPMIYSLVAPLGFRHGVIFDMVHPYVAIITVFMAIYMYRYMTEFKEKLQLKGAFGKYVNPEVVEQIMAHPENLKLGGEKREISVLFTDIAHFTSISEKLTPESLVALLNEYFEAMSEVIMKEEGTLDKFEGDAIMAFFGAPLAQPDHALRACRTALKMRERLETLMAKWQQDPPLPGGEKKPLIDFRCGISTGEVIVGNVGSLERFDYTIMGDVVNLGSRLEGANKKYETHTMISKKTWEVVQNDFETRELDMILVVGKKEPTQIYELLNEKGKLIPDAVKLLQLYAEGIALYHERKFKEALEQFDALLKVYPGDGPSKLYRQRCEVLRDFPPAADWDGVFEMGSK